MSPVEKLANVKVLIVYLLFFESDCKKINNEIEETQITFPVSKFVSSSSYLTSGKCNKNKRTQKICEILLKSKKFESSLKYVKPSFVKKVATSRRYTNKQSSSLNDNFYKLNEIGEADSMEQKMEHYDTNDYEWIQSAMENFDRDIGDRFFHNNNQLIYRYPRRKISRIRLKLPKIFPNKIKSRVLKITNKFAEFPLAATGIPFIWTLGIALLLKRQIPKQMMELSISEHEFDESTTTTTTESPKPPKKAEKKEKIKLAKEVLGLTAESLSLASNKIDLINVIAKTVPSINGFGGQNVLQQTINSTNSLNDTKTPNTLNLKSPFNYGNLNVADLVGNFVKSVAAQAFNNANLASFSSVKNE